MTTAKNPILPQLPDDIIHQILRLLPTKSAVRMRCVSKQFEDLWSINLDEGDPLDMDDDNPHQHTEFINFSETSLDSRKNDKHVDKFRLRMLRYSPKDSAIISRYLRFAFKRNVMVLDLSLRSKPGLAYYNMSSAFLERNYITTLNLECVRMNLGNHGIKLPLLRTMSFKSVEVHSPDSLTRLVSSCPNIENLSLNLKYATHEKFCLSLETLLGLKYITTLHLENMKIKSNTDDRRVLHTNDDRRVLHTNDGRERHLPLKTMSLKTVHLKLCTFHGLISRCPSVEYLSLSSCYFPRRSSIQFSCSSLKTLEVTDCNAQQFNVEATNLESFTLVSEIPLLGSEIGQLTRTALHECKNLKHVNIRSEHLHDIVLGGCRDCVEATIDTPNLRYFNFIGNLKTTISMQAPNLLEAKITLLCGRQFPTLVDFLKIFGHSKKILLHVDDAEVDFAFPESFRKSVSCPPLPSLKHLVVYRKEKLKGRDSDLRNSMLWMAPCAELKIKNK